MLTNSKTKVIVDGDFNADILRTGMYVTRMLLSLEVTLGLWAESGSRGIPSSGMLVRTMK